MGAALNAIVIGLGQVAWKFDEEPGRGSVWTHVGAYKALPESFRIVGACDPDAATRQAFAERHLDIPVASKLDELASAEDADVVSICTPAATHDGVLRDVMSLAPKVVWCEKPLAVSLEKGNAMVEQCAASRVKLVVSHVRRWMPIWLAFREKIESGQIGTLRSLRVAIPNRLWSMGSHAVDMLLWLGGEIDQVRPLAIPSLEQHGEQAVGAVMTFASGASGVFQVTGLKENLVVEAEAIGDQGRIYLREDRGTIEHEAFGTSPNYDGYRQLGETRSERVATDERFSPFVAIAREITQLASGELDRPECSGRDALAAQALLETLAAQAGSNLKSGGAAA